MIGVVQMKVWEAGLVPVTVPPGHPGMVTTAVAGVKLTVRVGTVLEVITSGPLKLAITGCVTFNVAVVRNSAPALFVATRVYVVVTAALTGTFWLAPFAVTGRFPGTTNACCALAETFATRLTVWPGLADAGAVSETVTAWPTTTATELVTVAPAGFVTSSVYVVSTVGDTVNGWPEVTVPGSDASAGLADTAAAPLEKVAVRLAEVPTEMFVVSAESAPLGDAGTLKVLVSGAAVALPAGSAAVTRNV